MSTDTTNHDPLAPTSVALETAQWLVSDESFYLSSENISLASFARYLRAAKKAADKGKKSICLLWLGRWREDFVRARSRAIVLARDKAVVAERWVLAEELVKGAHEELAHLIRSEVVKNEEKRQI